MNNLKQFEKYDIFGKTKEIIINIDFIEELIKLKRYNYVPLEARKILEKLLIKNYKRENLNNSILDFSKDNNVPNTIKKSMMFLKEKGNEAAHSLSLLEKNYGLESDIHSVIEIKKNLFIVLRYFVELTSNFSVDISTIKFNSKLIQENKEKFKKQSIPNDKKLVTKSKEEILKRTLQMMGMKTFIEYFMEWDKEHYLSSITADGKVSKSSAIIKRNGGRKIIKLGMVKEALEMVANSRRTENWVVEKAKKILNQGNY